MTRSAGAPEARLEMRVTGRVQGVAFRWHTQQQARRLGLVGTVRNRLDGSVEIVAEGDRSVLEALADWAGRGPDSAYVESREMLWKDAEGTFTEFSITG